MKKIILIIICQIFLYSTLFSSTPYHSLDRNDYYAVVKALKKPEWVSSYCKYNFSYIKDSQQYNKNNWVVSGKTIFQRKRGDCDDYAEFIYEVLKYHNYNPIIYWVSTDTFGHAVVVFEYEGFWRVMDNIGFYNDKHRSKNELLDYCYGSCNYVLDIKNDDRVHFSTMDEDTYYNKNPFYIDSDKLILHSHLTKANTGIHFFAPGFGGETYISSIHKESVGILIEIDSFYFSGIGSSISGHGFYANSFLESEKMYSSHFLFLNSRIGISYYFGDFNGVDIDLKIFDSSKYELYICCRDFGEVFDIEFNINIIKNSLRIVSEKVDKEYIVGTELLLIGNAETENIKYRIRNIDMGLSFNCPFAEFSIKYNYKQKDLASVSGTIKF